LAGGNSSIQEYKKHRNLQTLNRVKVFPQFEATNVWMVLAPGCRNAAEGEQVDQQLVLVVHTRGVSCGGMTVNHGRTLLSGLELK
jgi:hypothetical protein